MKPTILLLAMLLGLQPLTAADPVPPVQTDFPEVEATMHVEERRLGKDANGSFFVIERKAADVKKPRGLLVILPGGPGTRDFLPFCVNGLTQHGTPGDFMAVQLVAPVWEPTVPVEKRAVIWSSATLPVRGAKFSCEEFIDKAVASVMKTHTIDPKLVFTLGWSSSGHVVYSAATRCRSVTGTIAAMSRFLPATYIERSRVRRKPFFLYHSPDDTVCPYSDVPLAEKTLTAAGAIVKIQTYPGGHGWTAGTDHMKDLRDAIDWLRTAGGAGAAKSNEGKR